MKNETKELTQPKEWMKAHKPLIICGTIIFILIAIVIIIVAIINQHNDTFYLYDSSSDEFNYSIYYTIKGNSWTNENRQTGKVKFDNESVIFILESFDGINQEVRGTISNNVLKFNGKTYVSKKHKHKYEKWETLVPVTCAENGTQIGICSCNSTMVETIARLNHNWGDSNCTICGQSPLNFKFDERTGYKVTGLISESIPYIKTIKIPATYKGYYVTSIGYGAFETNRYIEKVSIENGVTLIDDFAFTSCDNLQDLFMPDSIKSIGGYAFAYCDKLEKLKISKNLNSIGWEAFAFCSNLKEISVPSDCVKYYGSNNCIMENNMLIMGCCNSIIPNNVTKIYSYAFSRCLGMTSITIPKNVTQFYPYAFYDCIDLKLIIYNGTCLEWNAIEKGKEWDFDSYGNKLTYTVKCIDGEIK